MDGVTKIGRHSYVRRDEAQAETFRKLILASVRDIRVILVKLADRLHNMMTLEHMPEASKQRIAQETLEIYAPTAHRLGMSKVQGDLEDLAFFHLYPEQFAEIQSRIQQKIRLGKQSTEEISRRLRKILERGRNRGRDQPSRQTLLLHLQKDASPGHRPSQLYDYLAFRVITTSVRDCYAALGNGASGVATRARAVQGLHRHAQAQPLSITPYDAGQRQRSTL